MEFQPGGSHANQMLKAVGDQNWNNLYDGIGFSLVISVFSGTKILCLNHNNLGFYKVNILD